MEYSYNVYIYDNNWGNPIEENEGYFFNITDAARHILKLYHLKESADNIRVCVTEYKEVEHYNHEDLIPIDEESSRLLDAFEYRRFIDFPNKHIRELLSIEGCIKYIKECM